MGGEPCPVIGAAENPELGTRRPLRLRRDRAKGMFVGQGKARDPGLQLVHLPREFVGGIGVRIERKGRQPVRARRAAHAKVDTAWRERFEHAELLGDLERGIMRQHDARAAHADAPRGGGDGSHQDFGRGADDTGAVVMLRDPVAMVAELVAQLRERERFANGDILRAAVRRRGLVEHRQFHPSIPFG